jgi:hypothetical protein
MKIVVERVSLLRDALQRIEPRLREELGKAVARAMSPRRHSTTTRRRHKGGVCIGSPPAGRRAGERGAGILQVSGSLKG